MVATKPIQQVSYTQLNVMMGSHYLVDLSIAVPFASLRHRNQQ
jgi:hypothetical protein